MAEKGLPPLETNRAKDLRRLHKAGEDLGREIERVRAMKSKDKKRMRKEIEDLLKSAAKKENLSAQTMFRLRKFANAYTSEELDELCGLGLGWGHVDRLLAVQDRQVRRKLAARASKKSWTARELWEQIRIRQKRRRRAGGGRGFRMPTTEEAFVDRLLQLTESWIRFHDRVAKSRSAGDSPEPEFPLPAATHEEALQRLHQSLKGLQRRAGRVLRRLR
jgi:hypothetical protein